MGFLDRGRAMSERNPLGGWSYDVIVSVWFWSELVILLTNEKRRALHDFIAGTIVVHA